MIIPFYTSSGEAAKRDAEGNLFGVNEFFPVWGIGPIEDPWWFNKTNYTWKGHPEETAIANDDRSKYYGSTKLRRIANELDALLPDAKAMIKQMEDQIPSSYNRLTGSDATRLRKLAAREFGAKDEEFNQGLIANGIVPITLTESKGGKVDENIRKAKKIMGLDGPITYKLVPFESGRNFAYWPIPDLNLGRFFVLVDINPAPKKPSDDPQPVTVKQLVTTVEEEEEEEKDHSWKLARERRQKQEQQQREWQRRRKQGRVRVGRR